MNQGSTSEAREIVDLFMSKHGKAIEAMNVSVAQMLVDGDGDSMLLFSNHLVRCYETIMQTVRTRPTMIVKDGLSLEDIAGGKVKQ